MGLISAALARGQSRAVKRHPSLMPISSRALRRCKDFLPDGAPGRRRFDRGASSATIINLLARFVGHPLSHALLCGTRCPHGHPPLSLEAASGGLLFFLGADFGGLLYLSGGGSSSSSVAASTISPSVSTTCPRSARRCRATAAMPCTGQLRSNVGGLSRPPCPGRGWGQVQPWLRASGDPGKGSGRPFAIPGETDRRPLCSVPGFSESSAIVGEPRRATTERREREKCG